MHICGDASDGIAFLAAVVEGKWQDEDFVVDVTAQVVDSPYAHVGHEIACEETAQVAEEEGYYEQQAHENQCLMLATSDDEVAHEPVEVAHQPLGREGELGLGDGLHSAFLEEQVEEWADKCKGEQREENGHQVEGQIQDDAAPIGFDVG